MFAAACGRRPKLTSHFIVWSEGDEDGDDGGGGGWCRWRRRIDIYRVDI